MELKVSSALNDGVSQNNDTKEMVVQGAASIYPHLIPQTGDVFVADVGEGRAGVFTVINVTRQSMFKETVHTIEYKQVGYAGPGQIEDLKRKTVQNYVFIRDYLYLGQNPHVIEEDWHKLTDLQRVYQELVEMYFADFFSERFETLLVPDQANITYDPYMAKFVRDILDVDITPKLRKMRTFNIDANKAARNATTVLDAIKDMSASRLVAVVYTVQLQDISYYRSLAIYNAIFHSGVQDVVFPAESRTDVDARYQADMGIPPANGKLTRSAARVRDLRRLIQKKDFGSFDILGNKPDWLPDIHRVADDPFYIFTERFYFSRDGQRSSKIEIEVHKYLNRKPVDLTTISNMAQRAPLWDNLERFYLIPVLLVLIQAAYRGQN